MEARGCTLELERRCDLRVMGPSRCEFTPMPKASVEAATDTAVASVGVPDAPSTLTGLLVCVQGEGWLSSPSDASLSGGTALTANTGIGRLKTSNQFDALGFEAG